MNLEVSQSVNLFTPIQTFFIKGHKIENICLLSITPFLHIYVYVYVCMHIRHELFGLKSTTNISTRPNRQTFAQIMSLLVAHDGPVQLRRNDQMKQTISSSKTKMHSEFLYFCHEYSQRWYRSIGRNMVSDRDVALNGVTHYFKRHFSIFLSTWK